MGTGYRVMTRRLVIGTNDSQSIRSMGNDARVDGRQTDDEDESVRVSRCVCYRGIVDRRCVITRMNECMTNVSVVCLQFNLYGYTV